LLADQMNESQTHIYSHELAKLACVSAAQVRRDIMTVDYSGTPNRGYEVRELLDDLSRTLDQREGENVALLGIGNIGRALIAFFAGRRPKLAITAAFDSDPSKVNRVLFGCRCHPMESLREVIEAEGIRTAILTVPPRAAQAAAAALVDAGITGILNYAAVPLRLPRHVYLTDYDMTMALETVAFFARRSRLAEQKPS